MPEIRLQLPEEIATRVLEYATAHGMTVDSYITEIITRETYSTWPEGFFQQVVGGWRGEPLQRFPLFVQRTRKPSG